MDILSEIVSWVSRILGGGKPSAGNSWQDYARLSSPARPSIVASDLVDMSSYRKAQRMAQCGGIDPLEVFVAYAQDNHVYDAGGRIAPVDAEIYRHTPPDGRVNKFKQVYRHDAKLLLHKALADIVVDAAMELQTQHGWKLRLYDGLRTVDAAFLMHYNADPKWLEAGLLAKPGESAHNRGLAIDSMVVDAGGREIDMGGH
ncbi:MAG: hypothetical protein JO089_05660, partial [Alphaproteobacteria bacterium]|nr:hypothetical protein [Alphaproteobacteria bacterium]